MGTCTFLSSSKSLGLQLCLHNESICPLKCILSMTISMAAIFLLMSVSVLLTGLLANFLRVASIIIAQEFYSVDHFVVRRGPSMHLYTILTDF